MKNMFAGTGVAIVTPFSNDLAIDYNALESLINHVISGGIDYIVALGTTGETATLTQEEKLDIIQFCKEKVANRVPIVVGAGGNNTMEVANFIKSVDLSGISGILSVAPYYNKPSDRGMFEHFSHIAKSSTLPLIIYNVPGRTSSNISAKTTIELAQSHQNVVAVKEASGNFSQLMEILKNKPDDFLVLSGDDALSLPMISLGVKGVISVVANSHPQHFSRLIQAALNGNFKEANLYQYQLIDYIHALFQEGSPSGIKAALHSMGICENTLRLPLCPVSNEHYNYIHSLIGNIN